MAVVKVQHFVQGGAPLTPPTPPTPGNLMFLFGLLLHLQRGKQESARIADLEAILQDRRQDLDRPDSRS